jgi:hypothetical protein
MLVLVNLDQQRLLKLSSNLLMWLCNDRYYKPKQFQLDGCSTSQWLKHTTLFESCRCREAWHCKTFSPKFTFSFFGKKMVVDEWFVRMIV